MAAANRLYAKVTKISPRVSALKMEFLHFSVLILNLPCRNSMVVLDSSSMVGAILETLKWLWVT